MAVRVVTVGGPTLSTRSKARSFRNQLDIELESEGPVMLDLTGLEVITHAAADELFGEPPSRLYTIFGPSPYVMEAIEVIRGRRKRGSKKTR